MPSSECWLYRNWLNGIRNSAVQTFYDEKRPFFLEGKHILDFANGSDMMFYTRRIGAAPSYTPQGIDNINSFADSKDNVPIIGALKLTGTNRRGVTVGVVQSVTARSSANVTRNGRKPSGSSPKGPVPLGRSPD